VIRKRLSLPLKESFIRRILFNLHYLFVFPKIKKGHPISEQPFYPNKQLFLLHDHPVNGACTLVIADDDEINACIICFQCESLVDGGSIFDGF
jgi:hypothetical protein